MKKTSGFLFVFLLSFCRLVFCEDISQQLPESPYRMIAPVFGDMAANQIFHLWENFSAETKRSIREIVVWERDAGILSHDILTSLHEKKNIPRERKKFASEISILGISASQDESARMAVRNQRFSRFKDIRLDQAGFDQFTMLDERRPLWIIVVCSKSQLKEMETGVMEAKGQIVLKTPSFELEFLEDRRGRQLLEIGSAKSLKLIYERLVARNVNPIEAKRMAQRSIDAFRSDQETLFVVVQL